MLECLTLPGQRSESKKGKATELGALVSRTVTCDCGM